MEARPGPEPGREAAWRVQTSAPLAQIGESGLRYLVTGAAGFIGSHLVEALLGGGHEVVGIDSFSDYYDPALKERNVAELGIEVRRLDLARDEIDLAGFNALFHLAGQPGVRSFGAAFPDYLRDNALASQRVFESAAAAGVRVVHASSSSVYGDAERYPTPEETVPRPNSPYGVTKLASEHLAAAYGRSFGLEVVGLRYFTVYGPRQRPDMAFARIVDALARGASFEVYGDGTQSRSFTYVSDVVEATIRALEAPPGSIYNVGGGEEASLREALELLESIAGRPLDVVYGPPAPGDTRRTCADTTKIERELGWRATTPLRRGLGAHWEWAISTLSGP